MSINTIIEQLRELEVPNSGIKAALKKKGYSPEEIAEALPAARRESFASRFYDWLAESPRSAEEVEAYVMEVGGAIGKQDDKGLTNTQRHLSHFAAIGDLALRIHNQK